MSICHLVLDPYLILGVLRAFKTSSVVISKLGNGVFINVIVVIGVGGS